MLHGTTTMPSVRNDPLEMAAPWSSGLWHTDASAATSRSEYVVSCASVVRAQRLTTRCVSTSSSFNASSRRTPMGAPVAPVMATTSFIAPSFRSRTSRTVIPYTSY